MSELLAKRDALLTRLAGYGRVAVAFSGGVDSAVVARAAFEACGEKAVAVTAVSLSLASGELEEARKIAALIGIRHVVLETQEFENESYLANPANRCYFCKTELYSRLELRLSELGADVICNGANLDDQGDYRPGMTAAKEHAVRSPLIEAGLTKADVRELAKHWSLPCWDKPAMPCLSSRIAYGVAVTPERVARIDGAESFLRREFGLREFRVRCEANDLARIEIALGEVTPLLSQTTFERISRELRSLGFRCVTLDLEGFRSGNLNALVPLETLRTNAG
ncbi:MAG: ATP-dependent sacrificial sulfur transferase LarE [Planctomycetaceae bacterium]|nr:ATP-dependent sacrificial sulfur transferase LarE [Planctomycetaceae bacterium]